MKDIKQNSQELKCVYPNCDNCNETFEVPNCMLVDAGIDLSDSIIVIPNEGYVLIRQEDEENE